MSTAVTSILGTRNKDLKTILVPRKRTKANLKTQQSTEQIANYLVEKFQSPEHRPLFLRVAWRLDRGTIDRLVGTSFELGNNPRAYFITLVKQQQAYID